MNEPAPVARDPGVAPSTAARSGAIATFRRALASLGRAFAEPEPPSPRESGRVRNEDGVFQPRKF